MIPGQVMFGLHTAEFKKWITQKEASAVKGFFGLEPDEKLTDEMYFYEDGITKLWIQEVPGKMKPRYYIHIILNFTRASGSSSYAAMPYTTGNVKKVFSAVNKTLKLLHLSDENRKLQDWTVARFDSAFDIYEENTLLLIQLLNRSLNLGDTRKKCCRLPITGKTPQESMSQSVRFGNSSYVYNVYRKMEEILEKQKPYSESEKEELLHLLRVERQNLENACKKLLPNGKAGDLEKANVREGILKTMIDETALFFGTGDYYSLQKIKETYFPDHEAEIRLILNAVLEITRHTLEKARNIFTKEIADTFEQLGLAPVFIPEQFGADFMQGLYSRIVKAYPRPPDKRRYNSFPIPHRTGDGRYKATITLYQADGIRKQLSVAGRDMEGYEQKVLQKLTRVYLDNRKYAEQHSTANHDFYEKSADSVCRFCKAAKTKEARENAEWFVKHFCLDDKNNCRPALTAEQYGQPDSREYTGLLHCP